MNNKTLFKCFFAAITAVVFFASCDKDFNEFGTDIIGNDHFILDNTLASVVAFNQKTGIVQTSNLPLNSLGIYNNPVFGKTRANFVTQLAMANVNPKFDPELFVSLDSVVLTVPYFSHKTVNSEGTAYVLDSIRGTGSLNLKVYENGYYLTDLSPGVPGQEFMESQLFYSDDTNFEAKKIGSPLNNAAEVKENTAFVPDAREYKKMERDNVLNFVVPKTVESTLSPRMSLHLNKDYFMSKIINAPSGKLFNNSIFKQYLKGLYFKVEDNASGQMMQLDFSKGDVTLYYREHAGFEDKDKDPATPKTLITFDHDDDSSTPEVFKDLIKTFVLNMTGNTVNILNQENTPGFTSAISSPNTTIGDEKLYVKGGTEGSVILIDLFAGPDLHGADGETGEPNQVPDALDKIRSNKWLINEASLTFYVDTETMSPSTPALRPEEPKRVYLYDVNNKRPIFDYSYDLTKNSDSKLNKSIFGGILEKEEVTDGRGVKYKIRITKHINNIINKDSTNVRLGLVVTESIMDASNVKLKNPFVTLDRIPTASVMNPLGTVLWGNTENVPENKRLKLEIYYTKPK